MIDARETALPTVPERSDAYARGARERGIEGGQTGMVTALQRAGSGLNWSEAHPARLELGGPDAPGVCH